MYIVTRTGPRDGEICPVKFCAVRLVDSCSACSTDVTREFRRANVGSGVRGVGSGNGGRRWRLQENVAFQGNKPSNQSTTMAKRNREADGSQAAETEIKGPVRLDDLIQEGARQIIQQAIEAELKTLLAVYCSFFFTLGSKRNSCVWVGSTSVKRMPSRPLR